MAANPIVLNLEADYDLSPASYILPAEADEIHPIELVARLIDGVDINEENIISEEDISYAYASVNEWGDPSVVIELTEAAADRLGKTTSENIGKRIGFWIDGELLWSSKIHSKISKVIILGWRMSEDDANLLCARLLQTGAP